jgi:hypothetical protein
MVHGFFQAAMASLLAAVANVRWLETGNADLFFKIWAGVVTKAAEFAVFDGWFPAFACADVPFGTVGSMVAGVVVYSGAAQFFTNRILSDFPGNGRAVLADLFGNLPERKTAA